MNKLIIIFSSVSLFFCLFLAACTGQNKPQNRIETDLAHAIDFNESNDKAKLTLNGFNSGILDSHGHLWFGSNGGGVFRFDGESFIQLTEEDGLSSNEVFAICEDNQGIIWFGTSRGISKYENESFTHISLPFSDTSSAWLDKVYPVINPNAAHALAVDNNGRIWIGTGGGGAYRYDGEEFTPFLREIGTKQIDSLYHNWIPSIEVDANGNIWFASMTHGGASRYDGKSFTHFTIKDGLSDDMLRKIFKDKSNRIWFDLMEIEKVD